MAEKGAMHFLLAFIWLVTSIRGSFQTVPYTSLGCWKRGWFVSISQLGGINTTPTDPIRKCYEEAKESGITVFAVLGDGRCAVRRMAISTYNAGGVSTQCGRNGTGGTDVMEVYIINGLYQTKTYDSMGCWNNAHLRSLESEVTHQLLDDYKIRTHPIRKCYEAARRARKFIFALTDGGSCTVSSSQHNTYRQNGSSTNCGSKGTGGPGTINVYVTNVPHQNLPYVTLGCWKNGPLPSMRNNATKVGNRYTASICYEDARKKGWSVFAISDGGQCRGAANAMHKYKDNGVSTQCRSDGRGGPGSSEVYFISGWVQVKPYAPMGCFLNGPVPSLEGIAKQLDGSYTTRTDPIRKCFEAAQERGWRVFAVSDGGLCRTSANATNTFQEKGLGNVCRRSGTGGVGTSDIYLINGVPSASMNIVSSSTSMPLSSPAPTSSQDPKPSSPSKLLPALSSTPVQGSPLTKGMTVSCGDKIEITVQGNATLDSTSTLHLAGLSESKCSAVKRNGTFTFSLDLNDCGTTTTSTDEYIDYENFLTPGKELVIGKVLRKNKNWLSFRCRYYRMVKEVVNKFSGVIHTKHEMGSNNGTFDITFALYKDTAYSQPVLTNTSIDVSKNIYARLRLKTSSTSLKMTVQSCIASPHNTPLEYETYTHALIKGRCFADSTASLVNSSDPKEYKFKFQSFVFAKLGKSVYVHCAVVICRSNESTPTCTNPSGPCSKSVRRSTDVKADISNKYTITHGPFKQHLLG